MDNGQVTNWFEDLLPRLKKASSVEDEFLKYAHEENMAPALLEKLAQIYNTAKSVHYFKQADTHGISRGESFKVVDVDSLVDRFTKIATLKKSASTTTESAKYANLTELLEGNGGRAPHLVDWDGEDPSTDEYHEVKMACAAHQKIVEASLLEQRLEVTDQAVFEAKEDIRDLLGEISSDIMKVATDTTFESLEADAIRVGEGAFGTACDKLDAFMTAQGCGQKRASGPSPARFIRNPETFTKLATVQDKLNWLEMSELFRSDLVEKIATTTEEEKKKKSEKKDKDPFGFDLPTVKRDGGKLTTLEALQKGDGSAIGVAAQNTAKDIFGAAGIAGQAASSIPERGKAVAESVMGQFDTTEGILNKFRKKWKGDQEAIDEDFDQTARAAMIQDFLITDPILSDADPDQVLEMYNTLVQFSPELSKDKNVMRVALRSAIQHDGLAPQDLRQFLDTEHSIQVNRNNVEADKQRQYYNKRKGEKPTKHDLPEHSIR